MELDSRKKSRHGRMMRSNSFDMQKVREIGRKEAGELRGFPILWMEMKERVHRFRVRFGQERRASRLSCLILGFGDDRRSTSGSGDASLTIFFASGVAAKALPLSLIASSISVDHYAIGWCLMQPKEMENLATFSIREVKRAAAEERDEYSFAEGQ